MKARAGACRLTLRRGGNLSRMSSYKIKVVLVGINLVYINDNTKCSRNMKLQKIFAESIKFPRIMVITNPGLSWADVVVWRIHYSLKAECGRWR